MKNQFNSILLFFITAFVFAACGGNSGDEASEDSEAEIEVPEMETEEPNFWEKTIQDVDVYKIENEGGSSLSLDEFLEEVGPSISNAADIESVKIIALKDMGDCRLLAFKTLAGTRSQIGLVTVNKNFEAGVLNWYPEKDEGGEVSPSSDTLSNILYTPSGVRIEMYHSADTTSAFNIEELELTEDCDLVVKED
ncbi:hypothetical protein OO013_00625 [Mangrovivirga sp. M17]|uniref:Lipoprotein n=1 Tax=Mangrovivirga halotolerans TaxID=2993936 RepID=A0ABT3RKH6_9BACT|nr:hypothetical protein [Mangrovivirga halotolerans]MCX2742343.1 hypothetical protein [Mangrovivirga halotolerans]